MARAALAIAMAAGAGPVMAGAWPTPKGHTQIIVKAETLKAREGFDPDGSRQPLPAEHRHSALGVFIEHGLSEAVTLQIRADYQDGRDAYVAYSGRGPVELGLRWRAYQDDWTAVSLYLGHTWDGAGRNGGYAAPGMGTRDWEARLLLGRAFGGGGRKWLADGGFGEVQLARRFRDGLPDETRVDATLGLDLAPNWQWMTQVFAGAVDSGSQWAHLETSIVRRAGSWSFQAGWRETIWGREAQAAGGPVVALWRRF